MPALDPEGGIMAKPAILAPDTDMTGATRKSTLHRTAEERLRRSSYLALQDVSCIAREDVVYLHGYLPSHYLKQVAQEIAARVEGVRCVINRIKVLAPDRSGRERRPSAEDVA
jgi:osmotically-inducible protein OsmY